MARCSDTGFKWFAAGKYRFGKQFYLILNFPAIILNNLSLPYMRYSIIAVIISILSFVGNPVSGQEGVEIFIVPALHHIHRVNQNYSYDSIRTVVKNLYPDVILVEIRAEDIGRDTSYLKRNYPLEMWGMKLWFPNRIILGFDWLGKEIEGKSLPENYWKEQAEIKKWEKILEKDSSMTGKLLECETYIAERIPTLKEGNYSELINGNDEKLTLQYYQCLERKLFGSPHARVSEFYKLRNINMANNIIKAVAAKGKGRYVVVTGADHVPFIKMYLFKNGLGGALR